MRSILLRLGMERISSYVSLGTGRVSINIKNQLVVLSFKHYFSTKRYINADSFHPQSQKNAAFHSMVHRLCNFNLSEENYLKERDIIVQIGQINGYLRIDILKIIRKHENIKRRQELTTFIETRQPTKKRIPVPFFPLITNKLKKVFSRDNLEMVTTSGENKLKNKLMSTKDL
jgi:archaellin